MRVAIYSRVSKEEGGQDTETQMAQLREYAARNSEQFTASIWTA